MEINKDKVVMYIIPNIGFIIGELEVIESSFTKLKYPMLVNMVQGGVHITNIFMKEEWCKLDVGSIEIPVDDILKEGYIAQVQKLHSSIILPNDNIKKVII